MKGTILDYTYSEVFILLDDDSIITLPMKLVNTSIPIGSNINLSELYNSTYASHSDSYSRKNSLFNSL